MKTGWRRRGGWARLPDWEKRFGVWAGATSRPLGNMKDPAIFEACLRRAGFRPDRWAGGRQVHGGRVRSAARSTGKERPDTDGLITRSPGLVLRVFTADCVPVYLLDPVRRAVGLVHAGWRGVRKGIAARAVRHLVRRYGCRPADLRAALGPHLGPCCYEVGPDVARFFQGTPGAATRRNGGDRWTLDLAAALRVQLAEAGVGPSRVDGAPWCTVCSPGFFSYRRDRTDRRQAALLCVKEK